MIAQIVAMKNEAFYPCIELIKRLEAGRFGSWANLQKVAIKTQSSLGFNEPSYKAGLAQLPVSALRILTTFFTTEELVRDLLRALLVKITRLLRHMIISYLIRFE